MTATPRAATIKKVAEYFDVPPEKLTGGELESRVEVYDAQTKKMLRLFKMLLVMEKLKS